MGVEGGSSVSIGPSIAVSAGPAISMGRGGFGSVNEGPVRGSLEGFRPMNTTDIITIDKGGTVKPLGEIVFNAEPLTTESAISQAQAIISEARASSNPAVPQPEPFVPIVISRERSDRGNLDFDLRKIATRPLADRNDNILGNDKVVQPEVRRAVKQAASPSSLGQTEAVYAPAAQEQLVEEIAEERKLMTDPIDEQTIRADEGEEIIQRKKSYLVDQPVLAEVLSEADQAIGKGEEEAERLGLGKKIIGLILAKFLPAQHEGNTGGAVKPYGVDGTIAARKEAIAAKKEFASREEVEKIVLENRPVTIGENGERASQEEVRITFREHIVKPHRLREIFEKRVIRRRILAEKSGQKPVILHEVKPQVTEGTIEDLDLAEVFL